MEEEVRRELETLRGMVLNWKKDYLGSAPPDGGGEFLARELAEEIGTHVYPYLRRMYECSYLTRSEVNEFLDGCYRQVEDLHHALAEMGAKPRNPEGG